MKKRLLALALCLVMMVSLLPLTAAAYTKEEKEQWIKVKYDASGTAVQLTRNATFCGDIYIIDDSPHDSKIDFVEQDFVIIKPESDGRWKLNATGSKTRVSITLNVPGETSYITYWVTINPHSWGAWTSNGNGTHSRSCTNGCGTTPQTASCADNDRDHKCDGCGASAHTWQFKAAGNTLMGSCNRGDIAPVTLTLKADSVTLPKSPFETAQLVGWNDFQTATGAGKEDFVYRYKGPGDAAFGDPFYADPAKIKAGQYQVGVTITNLPGNVEDGNVATRANTNSAYLFTQYTAADPAVTAQTGDNRPIEIMLVCALAFSALAAAAFILDSKRKYSR